MNDPITVLVVDDEPNVREVVRRVLEREGYRVHVAVNGVDALKTLASGVPIHCLVTDMVMPEMDGITMAMKLHDARPSLPAVVISGRVDIEADSIRALAPLMNSETSCLLKKPFEPAQLLAAVRRALSRATPGS